MISEAIDAATTVGLALLVWIVAGAVFATAALYAVVAVAWVAMRIVRRTVRALLPRRAPTACAWRPWRRTRSLASTETLTAPPEALPAIPARTVPAWARTDKEAA